MFTRVAIASSAALISAIGLSGCGTAADAATVRATDTTCNVSVTEVDAGTHRFTLMNNGSKMTEVEIVTADDRAVSEVENIGPGTQRVMTADLEAGDYEVACRPEMKGTGVRSKLKVNGTTNTTALDPTLATAVATYRAYVDQQADLALTETAPFVAAIKAGDVAKAKSLYSASRVPWESIEPVAESFGDLDPRVDAREGDVEEGTQWTGWHRLEKDLWVTGLQPDSAAIADGLMTNLQELKTNVSTLELTPSGLSNGAQGLLDEVATSKVTGEEEAYSHTDLDDFAANVDGAEVAIDALRPYLQAKDAALLSDLDNRFKQVDDELAKYKAANGYKLYNELSESEIKGLSSAVDALSEPLSKVTGVVTGK